MKQIEQFLEQLKQMKQNILDSSATEDRKVASITCLNEVSKLAESIFKENKIEEYDEDYKVGRWFTGLVPCWVNAPSTLQPAHKYHGKNLVAVHLKGGGYRCCCVDDLNPVTFSLAENTPLVEGWNKNLDSIELFS